MRESYWAGLAAFIFVMILLSLTGCSLGTFYTPEGPHPHMNVAGEARIGPISVLHTPVSNADPVTDLTVISVTKGVSVGSVSPYLGVGWQVGRTWGTCDSEGFNCAHTYPNGYALSAGILYQRAPFRADLRALTFDNSSVGARTSLPLGIEAFVLLFGFDI